jgi:hypothetical protein
MPNSIKYSTTGDTQSLRDGNFYIGTGDVGKGPTSTTGHWNGITPPGGGYTVYKNKVSNGPAIWTATSDNQLISLTNNTEGTSFTTAQQCLNYYAAQTDKMVFNRDYEGIVTSGLTVCLDAGFTPSYQGSGTTWYDISGSNNHFTLYNSLSYNPTSGGTFSFDGTNDYARSTSMLDLSAANAVTVQVIGNASNLGTLYEHSDNWNTNAGGFGLSTNSDGNNLVNQYMHYFWNTNGGVARGARNFGPVEQSSYFFIETKVLVKNDSDGLRDYYNGNRVTYVSSPWGTGTTTVGNTTSFRNDYFYLGGRGGSSGFLQGNIAGILIYNRALSASEILQNYNAGLSRFNTSNAVKSGLILNLDASNIMSYPTTGTTWSDLSGLGNKGTLTNGPTFNSTTKSIVFDGVDDYVISNSNVNITGNNPRTFECWVYVSQSASKSVMGGGTQADGTLFDTMIWNQGGYLRVVGHYYGAGFDTISTLPSRNTINLNAWNHIIHTYDGSTSSIYTNGVFSNSGTFSLNTGNAPVKLGTGNYTGGYNYFQGNGTIFRVYKQSFTLSDVLQNYYQAPISTNNLALAIDPGNLVSYPGTGTTLNGLSPSGYTATLTNGPTYSSANGGTIVLDGVDDTITTSLTRVGYSNTTQIIWYKWDGVNKIASIMYLGDGGSTGYGFIVHDGSSSGVGNKVGILYGGSYYNAINVGTTYGTLVSGVWTQLAVTRDSTTTYLYQNGNLLGYTTRNPNGSASTLSLGVSSVVGGSIGPALFYNRALSADEIGQNFNCYKSRFGL